MQKTIILLLLILLGYKTQAQQVDSAAYNRYLDLNLSILEGRPADAQNIIDLLLPDSAKLSPKTRTSLYGIVGKYYEDIEPAKATVFYERVAAAEPNYYVVHRALGYLYLKDAEVAEKAAVASPADKQANAAYMGTVRKALPHLEKAQACDPSDETLDIIKNLYKKIKDNAGAASLNKRLAAMAKNCIDILSAE